MHDGAVFAEEGVGVDGSGLPGSGGAEGGAGIDKPIDGWPAVSPGGVDDAKSIEPFAGGYEVVDVEKGAVIIGEQLVPTPNTRRDHVGYAGARDGLDPRRVVGLSVVIQR